ncbi:MAG: ribosome silencing factor [Candidatus Bipolaricaulota bacterium]
MTDRELVLAAARILSDKKGEGIVLIDLSDVSIPTSFFLVVDADNPVHAKALVSALREGLPEKPLRSEGLEERKWVVLDYGDVVVHVFERQTRKFYDIESLWADHMVSLEDIAVPSR